MKKNRRKILSGSRKIFFAILAMFLSLSASAQQITASGQILDAQKEPLIGVSVQEKGTSNGAITDLDGNFTLNVKQNAILIFSYVGYKSQEVKAAHQMKITLQEDNEVLDEVVVIGYGSVKRKDVTTAISSVSTKDLDMRPIVSAGQAIQGKAAGVSVIQPNGTPGGEMSIRVRGTTSMNGSNDPLYVVDGVPVDNIKFLSPNDIESMQILKDASSASIYGSRAANGVILITTKAGAAGNAKVSLTAQFGLNKVADKVESLNAAQYKELQDEIGLVSLPDGLPDGKFAFSRSEGGLATGLDSLQTSYEKHWIGWPGICANEEKDQQEINEKLQEMNFHPVFLSEKQIENYYEGYSNSTIWPLCHYFYAYTLYKNCFWQSYQQVNRLFCEEICRLVRPGDKVWIQDYQLMLLPGMLRKIYPELCIGYFHHIPFPSYELFRILPERAEILKGLLGADFIAFHTHDYMRHFISAVERVLHLDFKLDEVQINNRVTRVEALPMGINYESYHKASENKEVHQAIERTRKLFGEHKLILSVDRLDYSKGILHRLRGFATFLEHHAEYHGKVTLAMVIVPSRDHVGSYAELKTKIDEEIGSINGRYSTMNWTPVCYFYHGFSLEELTAMYYVADIALVTPLRDGMNLVAKEYVASKCDNTGVLILSEMAGAAVEMTDAIQINPNDSGQIENAICQALEMPAEEQK